MPYMRYSRKVWDSVKANHQELKLWEIGKIIGQMWRELSTGEKQSFVDEYEHEKQDYSDALKAYQNSPAYQQYLAAKEKAAMVQQKAAEEKEVAMKSKSASQSANSSQKIEAKLSIPPVENDVSDELDSSSSRQLGACRFQRNQRLLYEIFSETCVPDMRSIVTNPRMHMLKRQVQSLTMHQKKLENELEQLEEKFQTKKRCLRQNTQCFNKRLKELSVSPSSDSKRYEEMVEKAGQQLLEQYQRNILPTMKEEEDQQTPGKNNETKADMEDSMRNGVEIRNNEEEEEKNKSQAEESQIPKESCQNDTEGVKC